MRTTLTIDPDVAERLRQEMKAGKLPFKRVVNEKLRIGLGMQPKPKSKPYKVKPFESAYVADVEQRSMNQLADELESEAYLKKEAK
ncbi:MAG: antitoxin [Verrucomicrobiota bacterium]